MRDSFKVIEVIDLGKSYGNKVVLNNISLSLEVGEFLGLLGAKGAGKTTLLRILALWLTPDKGKVFLRGKVHLVDGATNCLDPYLSVWQNLWLFSAFFGIPYRERKKEIMRLLSLSKMWELRHRKIASLSSREKGIVEVIRGILSKPSLLLLDQPESFLDSQGVKFLLERIEELREENNTSVLWATDKPSLLESADRIAIIKEGSILACDTPSNLKRGGLLEKPSDVP